MVAGLRFERRTQSYEDCENTTSPPRKRYDTEKDRRRPVLFLSTGLDLDVGFVFDVARLPCLQVDIRRRGGGGCRDRKSLRRVDDVGVRSLHRDDHGLRRSAETVSDSHDAGEE